MILFLPCHMLPGLQPNASTAAVGSYLARCGTRSYQHLSDPLGDPYLLAGLLGIAVAEHEHRRRSVGLIGEVLLAAASVTPPLLVHLQDVLADAALRAAAIDAALTFRRS